MTPTAIFPGSFDPITLGHLDVITRASRLFGKVIVAIGHNTRKHTLLNIDERVQLATKATAHLANISVTSFDSLTTQFAHIQRAQVIIRSLRNASDFDAEFSLAQMNHSLAPDIDTVFIAPSPQYIFISSTLVREILQLNGDIQKFVPQAVAEYFHHHRPHRNPIA